MKMMKQIFVLDENVFIQSHTCQSINNSTDNFDSLDLVIYILQRCHKIGLSNELREKYYEKSEILKKCATTDIAVRVWRHILTRNDKQVMCGSHQKALPLNISHDSHVIDPALFLSGILVTTDGKLKERLIQWAEKEKLTVEVMSPKEALDYLEGLRVLFSA